MNNLLFIKSVISYNDDQDQYNLHYQFFFNSKAVKMLEEIRLLKQRIIFVLAFFDPIQPIQGSRISTSLSKSLS